MDKDPIWSQVKSFVQGSTTKFPHSVKMPAENFLVENQILYLAQPGRDSEINYRTVLPHSFIPIALELCHSSPFAGHLGEV